MDLVARDVAGPVAIASAPSSPDGQFVCSIGRVHEEVPGLMPLMKAGERATSLTSHDIK